MSEENKIEETTIVVAEESTQQLPEEVANTTEQQEKEEEQAEEKAAAEEQQEEITVVEEEKTEEAPVPAATASESRGVAMPYELTDNIRFNADDSKYSTSGKRIPLNVNRQSEEMSDGVRRNANVSTSHFGGKLVSRLIADVGTQYAAFKRACEQFANRPCFGTRAAPATPGGNAGPYQFITYKEAWDRSHRIAAGLIALGAQPGQHIGIYSKNRVEWQLTSEACHSQSMLSISLYDSLGEDSSQYIVNHGEIHTLFCSSECLPNTLKVVPVSQLLKNVVCFDAVTDEQKQTAEQHNVRLLTIKELEELGAQHGAVEDVPPTPDTLSTIMYTSGTTGAPKGVMVTHRNFVAAVAGVFHNLPDLDATDVFLSYLPLAHILARVAEALFMSIGAAIGFWQGDIKYMRDDIQMLKPTLLPAVPRVLDRFEAGIRAQVASATGIKKFLLTKAFAAKERALANGGRSTPLWDFLVFKKLKAVIGGNVRILFSGGAPLRPEVQKYLSVAFDAPCVQGYGLTETCAACTIQVIDDPNLGRIGGVLPNTECKLVDVPEMNYLSTNNPPQGELLIRGPSVAVGYYKDDEKTKEAFYDEGWFATGDIAQWNPDGSLKIIDRKKNIFKLAQGEYVAVESIELKLNNCPFAASVWVYGESTKSCLVGVIAVNPATFVTLAKEKGFANASEANLDELVGEPSLVAAVEQDLSRLSKELKLRGFEYLKKVTLVSKTFDQYEGCTTPSMKLVRNQLRDTFQADIDRMYKSIGE